MNVLEEEKNVTDEDVLHAKGGDSRIDSSSPARATTRVPSPLHTSPAPTVSPLLSRLFRPRSLRLVPQEQ
jgi:hypothetical protein